MNDQTEPPSSKWATDLTKAFQEVIRGKGCNFVDYLENGFEFVDGEGKRFRITIKEINK